MTRDRIDGRTSSAKLFDAIARGVADDQAGERRLSTVRKHLIEMFAGAVVKIDDLKAQIALGQPIDVGDYTALVSTACRLASRIGLDCAERDVTSFGQLLAADADRRQREDNIRNKAQREAFEREQALKYGDATHE